MNAAELKNSFLIQYDKVTNFAAPGYTDDEISYFLNKAQLELIKEYYNYQLGTVKSGFEETESRRKELSKLVKEDVYSSPSYSGTIEKFNVFGYNIQDEILYAIHESIFLNEGCDKMITVLPITHDELSINIHNPFLKPNKNRAWRLDIVNDSNRVHELITDGSISNFDYKIRYIKKPIDIDIVNNVTSELDDSVHYDLVDKAVRIAASITDIGEYQVKLTEDKQIIN
jgi:hypothetical protein